MLVYVSIEIEYTCLYLLPGMTCVYIAKIEINPIAVCIQARASYLSGVVMYGNESEVGQSFAVIY